MFPGALATSAVTAAMVGFGDLAPPGLADYQAVGWELAYLSLIGVLLAMLAWNYGTGQIGPMNATLLINLMPVTTFAYRAFQGYRFSPIELGGAALVVAALIANNLYLRRRHARVAAALVAD